MKLIEDAQLGAQKHRVTIPIYIQKLADMAGIA